MSAVDSRGCSCGGVVATLSQSPAAIEEAVRRHQQTPRHQDWVLSGGVAAMAGPVARIVPARGTTYEHGHWVPVDGAKAA